MKRSCPERHYLPEEPQPPARPAGALHDLERAARIADIKDRMTACLEELDRLELVYAANHLCHAIESIKDAA
jgi:hypothetical protein